MEWINALPLFLLVFTRMSGFFLIAPLFMSRNIPAQFKLGLAFFMAFLSFSYSQMPNEVPLNGDYWLLLIKEAIIGLAIGFVAALLLYAIQVAGIFIDMQIGIAMASMFDPQSGVQTPITGRLKYYLAMLFLLSLNGHHFLIQGMIYSFEWIAVDQWVPALADGRVSTFLIEALSRMFSIAVLIAIPVSGALFLVDVALGIVAKTVPQMNVFVVGLPLKIMANFLILLIVLPGFFYILRKLFTDIVTSVQAIIHILGA